MPAHPFELSSQTRRRDASRPKNVFVEPRKRNPVPSVRELDPTISPALQEIIYRALERDPKTAMPRRVSSPGIWSIRIRWAWIRRFSGNHQGHVE